MASPAPSPPPQLVILGNRAHPLRDLYHAFLTRSWAWLLLAIAGGFLAANGIFAVGYWLVGGVAHATSFVDDFFFSVQTMGTIGYGNMYPEGTGAEVLVVGEAVVSLIMTALATGLVFAKFSRAPARFRFARQATIGPHDGRPTLMIRLGNQRGSAIVDATIHVTLSRTETTVEGERFFRMVDLTLVRSRAPALSRAWVVLHVLDGGSPLAGATAATLAACEAEIMISVTGLDEATLGTVHARHTYDHTDLAWGMRHADVIREEPGRFIVDLTRFDEVVPATLPTAGAAVGSTR